LVTKEKCTFEPKIKATHTKCDSTSYDLLDIKKRPKGVEEFQNHHGITKEVRRNAGCNSSGFWQRLKVKG